MSGLLYLQPPRALLNGAPSPGALLSIYATGTSTRVPVYADPALTVELSNPMSGDAAGRFPSVYIDSADAYRARCVSRDDTELFDTDPILISMPFGVSAQPLDDAGASLPLATMTFYAARTTMLQPIYSDVGLMDELDNPITADSSGNFVLIFLDETLEYRTILHDSNGVQIYDIENVVGADVEPPAAPVLSGEIISDDPIIGELTWTAGGGGSFALDHYDLYRSVNGGPFTFLAAVDAGDPREYDDSGLTHGDTYEYYVIAVAEHGLQSNQSNTVELQAGDPDFGDVVVLLTANTGTLVEWSGLPEFSVVGAGALSDVEVKFGTRSFRNPGTDDEGLNYVRIVDDEDGEGLFVFPGEFTIEGWFFVVSYNLNQFENLFANSINFPGTGFVQLAIYNNGGNHRLFWNSLPGDDVISSQDVPLGQWVFLAFARDASDVFRLFIDGDKVAELSMPGTIGALNPLRSSLDVCRGIAGDNSDANCYFDQIRITKACRYTANFTPPTEPFPTS